MAQTKEMLFLLLHIEECEAILKKEMIQDQDKSTTIILLRAASTKLSVKMMKAQVA